MNQVVFLLLIMVLSVFAYLLSEKFPEEFRKLFSRFTDLSPNFEGKMADLKSFMFCFTIMLFLLGVVKIIFG